MNPKSLLTGVDARECSGSFSPQRHDEKKLILSSR